MSRKHKLSDCACVVDAAERYVSMCDKHEVEWREVHDRWTADHRKNHPLETQEVPIAGVPGIST